MQTFLAQAEQLFQGHPVWAGCTRDMLEQAVEGLEKYLMSKLWRLVYASQTEEVDRDARCQRVLRVLSSVDFAFLAGGERASGRGSAQAQEEAQGRDVGSPVDLLSGEALPSPAPEDDQASEDGLEAPEDRDREKRGDREKTRPVSSAGSRPSTPAALDKVSTVAAAAWPAPGSAAYGLLESATEELLRMDRFKAPRDKLVCLSNLQTLTERLVGQAVADGIVSGGGGDAFFPALLLVAARAAPAHLLSSVFYVRRFRSAPRLAGAHDFMLANLESVGLYTETVDHSHMGLEHSDFLRRMAEAGIPEAQMALGRGRGDEKLETKLAKETLLPAEVSTSTAGSCPTAEPSLFDASASSLASAPAMSISAAARRGPESLASAATSVPRAVSLPWTPAPAVAPDRARALRHPPLVEELVREGVPLVLEAEAAGKLQPVYPYLYARARDLGLGEVEQVLAGYKLLALQFEGLARAVASQLDGAARKAGQEEGSQPLSPHLHALTPESAPPAGAAASESGALRGTAQKLDFDSLI